jgi:hypothetical protein
MLYGYKGSNFNSDYQSFTTYKSNFIRNIDLKTNISPDYATMVTVGATANGYVKGTEATAFSVWNRGIVDRFKNELIPPPQQIESDPTGSQTEAATNYVKEFLNHATYCYGFDGNIYQNPPKVGNLNNDIIGKNLSVVTEFYKYVLAKKGQKTQQAGTIGFIPFKLSIMMDGISGIKIYNKLQVDSSFLPVRYGKTLNFIITGVNHRLQNNDWETTLETIVMPKTSKLEISDYDISSIAKEIAATIPLIPKKSSLTGKASKEPGFLDAVKAIEDRLGVDRDALLRIMKHESGLNPQARNPWTSATGLIQFMPNTALGLGTTVNLLLLMTGMQQLPYVEKFYKSFKGKVKTVGDLYMVTFLPAAVNKPDDFVIGKKGSKNKIFGLSQNLLYTQNAVFDGDGKGYYTVGDVKKRINSTY